MTFEGYNITKIDMTLWVDPFENMSLWFRTVMFSIYLVCILLGAVLYCGFISFEMNGGDPQKRGLTNQVCLQKP